MDFGNTCALISRSVQTRHLFGVRSLVQFCGVDACIAQYDLSMYLDGVFTDCSSRRLARFLRPISHRTLIHIMQQHDRCNIIITHSSFADTSTTLGHPTQQIDTLFFYVVS